MFLFVFQFSLYGSIRDAGHSDKPYLVREFAIHGAGSLKTYTLAGNIEVQSLSDTDKVRVELYIERGYAIWSGSRNLENYRINVLQRGNEVIASVEQKNKSTGLFSDNISFNFKIYVPRTMSTELKTLGGNIDIGGVTGDQLAKTGGGNIRIHDLSGKVGAYTTGGYIYIERSRGTIFAQTGGGNIDVDGSEGELRLKTSGGNIISEHIRGSFIARNNAGDIRAQFIDVGQGISIETNAGNIQAELPGHIGMDLSASGTRVNFEGVQNFYGDKRERSVEGRFNDGGIPVQLRASAGIITIKIR